MLKQRKAMHSPSCCYFGGSLYVAFYSSLQEGIGQKVFIFKEESKSKKKFFKLFAELDSGSGNPVLFTLSDQLYVAYSMFTQPHTGNVVELWKSTYTMIKCLSADDSKPIILSTYCAPRCNPYYAGDKAVLLPCYDEGIEKPVLFSISTSGPIERSVMLSESAMIQPTLVPVDGALKMFCRNFDRSRVEGRSAKVTSIAYSAAQKRILFSKEMDTVIPNNNESLAAIHDMGGNSIVVYNAEVGRKKLTVATIGSEKSKDGDFNRITIDPVIVINDTEKASYPNCCYNRQKQLVVVFTSYDGNGINDGSEISIVTLSKNYKKILSRKYISPSDIPEVEVD